MKETTEEDDGAIDKQSVISSASKEPKKGTADKQAKSPGPVNPVKANPGAKPKGAANKSATGGTGNKNPAASQQKKVVGKRGSSKGRK